MNIVEILILFVAPLLMLKWTLQFKKYFSLLSVGPILITVIAVMALNSDPKITFNTMDLGCPANSTTCAYYSGTLPYTIEPNVLTIVNLTTMIAMFMVIFVVFRRVTNIFGQTKESDMED